MKNATQPDHILRDVSSCVGRPLLRVNRASALASLEREPRLMKLAISVVTAVTFGLTCTAFADNYSDLAAQGYRWATVDGPYACTTEQDVQRITAHRTDATELQVVETIRCYYLIPGTIVQVIKEDPANGMSEVRLPIVSRTTLLWTHTRFLSKHPVPDIYGHTETPENSGLLPKADRAVISLSSANSTPEF